MAWHGHGTGGSARFFLFYIIIADDRGIVSRFFLSSGNGKEKKREKKPCRITSARSPYLRYCRAHLLCLHAALVAFGRLRTLRGSSIYHCLFRACPVHIFALCPFGLSIFTCRHTGTGGQTNVLKHCCTEVAIRPSAVRRWRDAPSRLRTDGGRHESVLRQTACLQNCCINLFSIFRKGENTTQQDRIQVAN